jgi:hypothetical protein
VREGTTSRMMAADRPYGELYDFYSVSPEYFVYHLLFESDQRDCFINSVVLWRHWLR